MSKRFLTVFLLLLICAPRAAHSQDVKRLEGVLQVSEQGQVSYGLPIKLLPAANGLVPTLAIQYSGHQQATELGQGWSISAGTFIQRCPAVQIESQRIAKPIKLERDDSFCLGSSRLVAVKGENGADNSEYRTAVDDGVKVVAIGQAGAGPLSFKVFRKNGLIETYGWREEARLTDPQSGTVFTWYLSTIDDRLSNRIDYLYSKSPENEVLLQEINYGGNLKTGLKPYRAVSFGYQKNPETIRQFHLGILSSRLSLLNRIHIFSESRHIWTYEVSFQGSDDVNGRILKSVKICAADGECSSPTGFEYQRTLHDTMTSDVLSQDFVPSKNWLDAVSRRILIDLNHDGFTDILGVINLFNKPNIVISRGSKTGFQLDEKIEISSIPDWKSMDGYPVEAGDFNRDGYADVLLGGASGFYVILGNASGFQNASVRFYPFLGVGSENERSVYSIGEANGDGYPDLIAFKGTGTWLSIGGPNGFAEPKLLFDDIGGLPKWKQLIYKRYAFDINSDGYMDIIGFNDQGTIVSLGNPQGNYQAPILWAPVMLVDWKARDTQTTFADVNGDGNIDIIGRRGEGIWVSLNTGKSFLNPELWHSNIHTKECPVNLGQLIGSDLNQDGFADFILVCGKFVDVIYGKGSPALTAPKFRQTFGWSESWLPKYPFMLDDTNGDGRPDINLFLPQGLTSIRNQWQAPQLIHVVDGFGFEQKIEWATLRDDALYKITAEKSFPYKTLAGPIRVVKSVDNSNGVGGFSKTSYRYENATSHFQLGFIGFETFVTLDETSKLEIATKAAMDVESQIFGVPLETTSFIAGGDRQLLKNQSFIWNVNHTDPGVLQILNEATTERNYEPGRALLSTIITRKIYDRYLNILMAESTTTDATGSSKSVLSNTYESYEATWELSRLKSAEMVSSKLGFKDVKKVSSFEYGDAGNVIAEISEPGSLLEKRIEYKRDALGIVVESKTLLAQNGGMNVRDIASSSTTDSRGYISSITSPVLQTQTYTWHPDFGTQLTETDANGLTVAYSYDRWGNRSSITRPDKVKTTSDSMWCNFTCPKNAVFALTIKQDGEAPVHSYVDMLGRQLRESHTAKDGRLIHSDVEFAPSGLQNRSSRPYFDGETPQSTYYFYDKLMRLSEIKKADDSTEHYAYDGFTRIVTDANKHKTTILSNALGQKLKTINDKGETVAFTYSPVGHLVKIEAPKGLQVVLEYDIYGRQILLNDPSIGTVRKKYNGLDLPYEVTENDGSITRFQYDALGRMIKRINQAATSRETHFSWTYDTAKNGIGRVAAVSGPRYETKLFYDILGRNSSLEVSIDRKPYAYDYGYDAYSRPVSTLFPSGFKEQTAYDVNGYVTRVFADEKTYWNPMEFYADGSMKKERLGNGVVTTYLHDERNGRLRSIVGESKGQIIHSVHVNQDAVGNVVSRKDMMSEHIESFDYDNLNRLKEARSSISGASTFDYDELGNLQRIADNRSITLYKYGTDCNTNNKNPLSVCKLVQTDSNGSLIKESAYTYDFKGAAIQAGEKAITYDGTGLPVVLRKGSDQVNFSYSPQGERFEREDLGVKSRSHTLYLPHGLELVEAGDKTFYRHNLAGMVIKLQNDRFEESYLHTDHQGSILAISNQNGDVSERFVFEPWGQKLKTNGSLFEQDSSSDVSLRGYTGHEMMDNVGLIHMNGRVYDSDLRRFISPDPHIQDPYNLQSINRYVYCWNNPMTNTDPSGYFSIRSIEKSFRDLNKSVSGAMNRLEHWTQKNRSTVASIAFSAVAAAFCPPAGFAAYAYAGTVGFTSSYIASNGDLNSAVQGGIVAIAFMGAGNYFDLKSVHESLGDFYKPVKIVAHGTVGGLSSLASGGRFESGFSAAGVSQTASVYGLYEAIGANEKPQSVGGYLWNAVAAGMVGGTSSSAVGGSFEQGAVTAAMGRLFNDLRHVASLSPWLGSMALADGPLPIGEIAAIGFGIAAWIYGDDAVKWLQNQTSGFFQDSVEGYAPDRELPRDKDGNAIPDTADAPHTQLGTKDGSKGKYRQGREFDANGQPVKDIDFTDHGRPTQHTNPHEHPYVPNSTGGTPRRDNPRPLNPFMPKL